MAQIIVFLSLTQEIWPECSVLSFGLVPTRGPWALWEVNHQTGTLSAYSLSTLR